MNYIFSLILPTLLMFTNLETEKNFHPFHVSNTELNYNASDKNLEVSCRVFTDDFELALGITTKAKADFSRPEMEKSMDEMVQRYMKTHLAVFLDGRRAELKYLGYEVDKEAVNIYLEYAYPSTPKIFNIENTLLYEAHDDQSGIIHCIVNDKRITKKINYPEKAEEFRF